MNNDREIIIGVDVDSTIFFGGSYPDLGEPIPGAIEGLKYLQEKGCKIILHTMRCDGSLVKGKRKDTITPVIEYLKNEGIEVWSVNVHPEQHEWTGSRKTYLNLSIDDINCGCPLIYQENKAPYVDWSDVMKIIKKRFNI